MITGCAMNCKKEERYKPWNSPSQEPDDATMKSMLAEALRIAIVFIMKHHIYIFDSKIKKQSKGGAIGLELTGDLAQVYMAWYDRQLRRRMDDRGIQVLLYQRYVDDINLVFKVPHPDSDERWMNEVKHIGNMIHPSTTIKVDYPSNHNDNRMPILDLKVWIQNRNDGSSRSIVLHEFYRKEVSSKAVSHARSAMPLSMKRTTMTQELLRIMLRCSPELKWEQVIPHLDECMMRMQFSGYDKRFRMETLKSALKG